MPLLWKGLLECLLVIVGTKGKPLSFVVLWDGIFFLHVPFRYRASLRQMDPWTLLSPKPGCGSESRLGNSPEVSICKQWMCWPSWVLLLLSSHKEDWFLDWSRQTLWILEIWAMGSPLVLKIACTFNDKGNKVAYSKLVKENILAMVLHVSELIAKQFGTWNSSSNYHARDAWLKQACLLNFLYLFLNICLGKFLKACH